MYLRTTQRCNKDGSVVRLRGASAQPPRGGKHQGGGAARRARATSTWTGCGGWSARSGATWMMSRRRNPRPLARPQAPMRSCGWRPRSRWARRGCWTGCGGAWASPTRLRPPWGGRFSTDVERALFALVANRAVDPCSKLAAAEWASEGVAIPGLGWMDEDQAYRAMGLLADADVEGQVQRAVFCAAADLLNLGVDLLLFDTTSTYFERGGEEADGQLRRYGHS